MYKYKAKKVNGKRIDEHRLIMEQHLGRKLERNEVVHHIDGDKRNNDINNLELMTLSEHSRMHGCNRKISEETREKLRRIAKNRPSYNRDKTKSDIIKITLKYKEIQNYREVDRYFGFSNGTTGNIIRGKNYSEYKEMIDNILNY